MSEGVVRIHDGAYSTSLFTLSLFCAVYQPMMLVPHDHPSKLIFETPRRLRMKSTAAPTSFTAVSVRTIGSLSAAGLSISGGRVDFPYPQVHQVHVIAVASDVVHPG